MTSSFFRNLIFGRFSSLLFLLLIPAHTFSQSDLVIEGNVLGYELNEIKPFGTDGAICEYPSLVKITGIAEGEEKSQYVIVLLKYLEKEYAEKNFAIDKITSFKLVRRTNYFLKPKDLLRKGFITRNGKIEKGQTFRFAPNVDEKDLPLNKKLPVYVEIERR